MGWCRERAENKRRANVEGCVQLTYFATLCIKLGTRLRDYIGVGTLLVQGPNGRLRNESTRQPTTSNDPPESGASMTTERILPCLSREVWDLAQRPFEQRRMYLHEVEKSRGKAEADKLR